jgi:hypothetical protein
MNYSSSNGGNVQPSMYYLFYRLTLLFCPRTRRTAPSFPIQVPWSGTNKMDIMYSFPCQACDHVPTSYVTSPLHEPSVLRTNKPFKCFDSCRRPYCLQSVNSSRCCQLTVPSGNVRVGKRFAAVSSANNTDVSSIYTWIRKQ